MVLIEDVSPVSVLGPKEILTIINPTISVGIIGSYCDSTVAGSYCDSDFPLTWYALDSIDTEEYVPGRSLATLLFIFGWDVVETIPEVAGMLNRLCKIV